MDQNGKTQEETKGSPKGGYIYKSDLGTGNFSRVRLAAHSLTRVKVAVKIIKKAKLDEKTMRMVAREIFVMEALSHPNLIRLYEVSESVAEMQLFMEYANGGELFSKLMEDGPMNEETAKDIFSQLASAVEYMHQHNFIHRDIKAENVFFAGHNIVKLGDFGFATQVVCADEHLKTFCGSPPYAAPELFQDDHYLGPSVDIWALGILLYFLVTGMMPFKGQTVAQLKHSIIDGYFSCPDQLSTDCSSLIHGILRKKPETRLDMQEIRNCDWLLKVPWPSPDRRFVPVPLLSDNPTLDEKEVLRQMRALDFTNEEVAANVSQGCRSHVIGTYRILFHKLINNSEPPKIKIHDAYDETLAESVPSSPPKVPTRNGYDDRSRLVVERREDPKKQRTKSKTCEIL